MMMHEAASLRRAARRRSRTTSRWRGTRAGAPAAAPTRSTCPPIATTSPRSCARCRAAEPLSVRRPRQQPAGARRRRARHGRSCMHNPGAALAVADGAGLRATPAWRARSSRASPPCTAAPAPSSWPACPGTVGGALAMNAGCYGGETWRHVARVEVLDARRRVRVRTPARLRDRLPHRARARMAGRWTASSPRPGSASPRASRAGAGTHQGAAVAAHRDPAAVAAQRRQRVPQSARRPRGAADRALRAQRAFAIGGAQRVGQARQLHRESGRQGARGRHRGADRARARHVVRERDRHRARARSAHRRRERAGDERRARPREFGKVAVLLGGPSAEREISLHVGQRRARGAARARASTRTPFDPAERDLCDLKREGFDRAFIALHGRFGEDGTVQGALETLRHSVHRQRRDGLRAGDGQVAHQARLARERHPDAALPHGRRAHRLDARRRRARPAAHREAGARGLDHRHHQGRRASITTSWRSRTRERAKYDALVLAEEFVDGPGAHRVDRQRPRAAADPHRGAATATTTTRASTSPTTRGTSARRACRRPRSRRSARGACARSASSAAAAGARLDLMLRAGRLVLAARGEHLAGHDRPQPRADGGARGRHVVSPSCASRSCEARMWDDARQLNAIAATLSCHRGARRWPGRAVTGRRAPARVRLPRGRRHDAARRARTPRTSRR